MNFELDEVETRVLGALMEKEAATPEYYPLSLNALVNACNQKSNRDPVVSWDEDTVEQGLERLRAKGLASRITGSDMRVPKHAHRLSEVLNLGRRESAVLCVLLLRGSQTAGEVRVRTERLYGFEDLDAVESTLGRLIEWQSGALVSRLPRQPGFKEVRYAHLLSGEAPAIAEVARPETSAPVSLQSAVEELQRDVAELKRQMAELRRLIE